jgi:hypothetical protein
MGFAGARVVRSGLLRSYCTYYIAYIYYAQDESAYHSNDDCKSEWAEDGKGLSIKQKSRGSLLMVSMFISELQGVLRCTPSQRDAYIQSNPQSHMAAKLTAQPDWDGSSTLILEPGAAPNKDKYFDAEQLHEQTKITIEIFEATHFAPGRWAHHPSAQRRTTSATYPHSFVSMWLPPTPCKAQFFYDHSSGHGAYASNALVASHLNKGPDWKGSVPALRDGFFADVQVARRPGAHSRAHAHRYLLPLQGVKTTQAMQFSQGDILKIDVACPPGLNPHADTPAAPAPAPAAPAPDIAPPTDAELEAGFKLFYTGCQTTIKKHNPGKSPVEFRLIGKGKWDVLPPARRMVYVGRAREKAAATPAQERAEDRVIKAGQPVPRILWGKNKGMEYLLHERGLYPVAGLKGACQASKDHSDSNDCCCARLLSVQRDFAAECSALQHLVEERILVGGVSTLRHLCLFLPKVPPPKASSPPCVRALPRLFNELTACPPLPAVSLRIELDRASLGGIEGLHAQPLPIYAVGLA